MNESDIIRALENRFKSSFSQSGYMLNNVYLFGYYWESDFLLIRPDGKIWEFEIKVTRADFLNDQKNKRKKFSLIHSGGIYFPPLFSVIKKRKIDGYVFDCIRIYTGKHAPKREARYVPIPDRFFYCAPKGLINKEEIDPKFGLYEVEIGVSDPKAYMTKRAADLGNKKAVNQKKIMDKLYWKWRNAKTELKFYQNFE